MTRKEQLREQYEDALFALLMDEVAASEGNRALEENERLKRDPDAAVPEETQQKCLQFIEQQFRARSGRSARRTAFQIFRNVSMVALLAALLFTAACAMSPVLRQKTLNFMMETFSDHAVFSLYGDDQTGSLQKTVLYCNWIPDGFVLIERGADSYSVWNDYEGTDGAYILIRLSKVPETSYDAEDVDIEQIEINGHAAMLVKKLNNNDIVWINTEDGYTIKIATEGISEEDVIKVAENLCRIITLIGCKK